MGLKRATIPKEFRRPKENYTPLRNPQSQMGTASHQATSKNKLLFQEISS